MTPTHRRAAEILRYEAECLKLDMTRANWPVGTKIYAAMSSPPDSQK